MNFDIVLKTLPSFPYNNSAECLCWDF